jgi:quinol-cytochrome oxidoreductase complex cytochrome b subunit
VQKHGMSIPNRAAAAHGGDNKVPTMPFVPHFLVRDMVGWYLALAILAALAALFPWELGEKADPFASAPEGIKPEWYFLFMFQTLKQLPPHILGFEGEVLGVLFFGLAGLVVLVVPFLDRGPASRKALNALAALAVLFFIVMTAWGYFDDRERQLILGLSLLLGVLMLPGPFLERGQRLRWLLFITMAIVAVSLATAIAMELVR